MCLGDVAGSAPRGRREDLLEVRPGIADVASAFCTQRERRLNEVFLRCDDRTWTWADTASQAHALACSLQDLGVENGDRIAATMPNWPEVALTILAAA
jgi:acyl-coenzyme A synthetase/AMP-(fatty) acid ligase